MSGATPFARVITDQERIECIALATLNEEKAAMLPRGYEGLRAQFALNAELLRKLADAPKMSQ